MFQGETAITLDEKGRLTIPTCFREQVEQVCGGHLVVTYNPFESGSLYIYPQPVWEGVRDKVNALPSTKSSARLMQFKLVGSASLQVLDGSARISISASQRKAVRIERRAILIGMGNKFELWSEEAHAAQIARTLSDEDMDSDLLEGLSL
ncbi:transcriptional regulator MraZ [Lysobacteraceae bacterium NML75-0749]|nr:transcriptional regulator MraZ [Xanthomonadaceae bacterium NML75-0749]PJJ99731.1 transcriptional regulator MraZ [Xanthomonadaceae bacterium NML03-0222]PJK02411.1 transcriptional regulator MraZ [Xanthomonadaceae bacterium NML71-0210]PJK06023.1 transcriptional regulator MraZ [Xanthomonadaceae bacterium NML91-0268]